MLAGTYSGSSTTQLDPDQVWEVGFVLRRSRGEAHRDKTIMSR